MRYISNKLTSHKFNSIYICNILKCYNFTYIIYSINHF